MGGRAAFERVARPLVVTSDAELLDDLLRLGAAASAELDAAPDPVAARGFWASAPLILIGDDVALSTADAIRRARLRRRPRVVLVGRDTDDADVWPRAVEVGAEHVALLPAAEPWLIGMLADAGEAPGGPARVVAVVGGRGGAGASSLAAALTVSGLRRGLQAILIDADPLGGGADLLFGGEQAAGARWPDLVAAQGRIPARTLREALPSIGEMAVLSWDRGDVLDLTAGAMVSVLDAATRACELVVVDLPRCFDAVADVVLAAADLVLIVVPAEVRATAAATRVAMSVAPRAADVRLVVRGPAPGGLTAADIAAAVGLPLAGDLRAEPDIAACLERGEVPAGRGVGPLADFCASLLRDLTAKPAAAGDDAPARQPA